MFYQEKLIQPDWSSSVVWEVSFAVLFVATTTIVLTNGSYVGCFSSGYEIFVCIMCST